MHGPSVTVDLERIECNARAVVAACARAGVSVFGVTKGTCGMPQVARAMLRGGVIGIGESRFENIRRLRDSGIDAPVVLLRSPPLSRIEEVVATVDVSLNSELAIVEEISRVAERMGRVHDVILMVDLGDLREGIWPDELIPTVERVHRLPGVRLAGLGTNLTCFGAVLPTRENMAALVGHAREVEARFGLELRYVSGGNSSTLPLLLSGGLPPGIDNLRIGEAILQGGRDTFGDSPWTELDRDAFALMGELLEVKVKPSMPIGETGVDAFGRRPVFVDRGDRLRGIVNVGREDVIVENLLPVEPGVEVLGASSDHLVVDVTEMRPAPRVGDRLSFRMGYGALLAAMTSEYVAKLPMLDVPPEKRAPRVELLVEPALRAAVEATGLRRGFDAMGLAMRVLETAGTDVDAAVAAAVAERATPLLVGVDHSLSLAGLSALARCTDAFGLLWFDATASFLPSGRGAARAPADTVLYRALGHDAGSPSLRPQLSPENVVLVGLRDVDPEEAEIIRGSRVTVFTMTDVDALGIREVMRQALQVASAGTRGLYVSYAPEVTDLPGMAGAGDGITVRETHQAMESVAGSGRLLAIDVVGLAPDADPGLAAAAAHFVLSCFGKRII